MPKPFDPAAFGAFEHAGWERAGEEYPESFGQITRQCAEPLLDAVRTGPGLRLLDVACGPGFVAAAAAARGARAVGIDFSSSMVALARRAHPAVEFRQADAEALPFPDADFDAVVCAFGILHFPRPAAAIAEACRVLRPGGTFALTDWVPNQSGTFLGLFADAVKAHGNPRVAVPPGPPVGQFADRAHCSQALQAAGFAAPQFAPVTPVLTGIPASQVVAFHTQGTVRTRAVFDLQTPEQQTAIRNAITEQARLLEHDGVVRIPCPALLTWAVKP